MTDEYIRKQDAFDAVNHALDRETILFSFVRKVAISALKGLHAADVVPMVRCKECKFRENDDFCTGRGFPYQLVPDDGFCDKGEREE